jgi:hypothetical protein
MSGVHPDILDAAKRMSHALTEARDALSALYAALERPGSRPTPPPPAPAEWIGPAGRPLLKAIIRSGHTLGEVAWLSGVARRVVEAHANQGVPLDAETSAKLAKVLGRWSGDDSPEGGPQ